MVDLITIATIGETSLMILRFRCNFCIIILEDFNAGGYSPNINEWIMLFWI